VHLVPINALGQRMPVDLAPQCTGEDKIAPPVSPQTNGAVP
jgi:hypothetical protein